MLYAMSINKDHKMGIFKYYLFVLFVFFIKFINYVRLLICYNINEKSFLPKIFGLITKKYLLLLQGL